MAEGIGHDGTGALDRRVRRTRRALRQALQTLLEKRQFEQITIRDLAEEADIAYTTFFRNYDSKDDLLADLMDDEIGALLDLILPMFAEQGRRASVMAMCIHVRERRSVWNVLLTGGAYANLRAAFIEQTNRRMAAWPKATDWLPADIGTRLLTGVSLEVLAWWFGPGADVSIEEVAGILIRFFGLVDGVGPD